MKSSRILPDSAKTIIMLAAAYGASRVLTSYSGNENPAALIHILALVLICRITDGYVYGILAAVAATISINYFFMYPYSEFNFTLTGYPLTMLVTLSVSAIVSALASRAKRDERQAVERERQTRMLYERNEALSAERTAVQVEAAREKLRGNLLRAVSHDLRTPLTGISGASSVLLSSDMEPEQQRELLSGIHDNAEWLIRVVENLLAVTRIEGQPASLKTADEAAEEVAANAVRKLRSRFPQATVRLCLPEELLLAPMDPLLIEQVLLNLLENAVRHSGAPDSITLRLSGDRQGVTFTVTDQGRGLPREVLDNLASGVWPELSGDTGQGAGIGLSVCQSIIQAHGGQLTAAAPAEGGTEMSFTLPCQEGE